MQYELLTDELMDRIAADVAHQGDWLILHKSDEYPGYWAVEGLDPHFFYDFEELIGRYRLVSPVRIEKFLAAAKELEYRIVWAEDPCQILDSYQSLKQLPDVSLNSDLENTVQGFLPWQITGYNKFIQSDLPVMLAVWSTGGGKTQLAAAIIKHYISQNEIDCAFVTVKTHNRTDTQRKLKQLADLDSLVVDGYTPLKRMEVYEEIERRLELGQPTVVITNYEKFREDRGIYSHLVKGRRVFWTWDEAPVKLSNRNTQVYDAVKYSLYKTFSSKPYPSWMRHLVLSATPLEKDPDGLRDFIHLFNPFCLGTIDEFHNEYVATYHPISWKPERWQNLDKLEAKLDHMTHRVSKADPDVAAMFPEVIRDVRVIDWDPKHRAVYDKFVKASADLLAQEDSGVNALSVIQVLQMLCDGPSMIKRSAANREVFSALLSEFGDLEIGDIPLSGPSGSEAARQLVSRLGVDKLVDQGHTKLETWREIICEKHPEEKVVTHSTWANYIFPIWHLALEKWGVSYVTYTGTDKQKQAALDQFRDDPSIRVFLSGDSGSDSIDIAEASVGVNYNGSWRWTTEKQREGRRDRVNSTFSTIYTYTLMMANSVEDRKRAIRDQKYGYHAALFEGRAVEGALSARISAEDLRYMIFGDSDE